jgi:hypothetical protein
VSEEFLKILLQNHFITEKKLKKKPAMYDEPNFPFFFLLHKRAKPAPPPFKDYKTFGFTLSLYPKPRGFIKPLVLPLR